jgi:hypothetical protein
LQCFMLSMFQDICLHDSDSITFGRMQFYNENGKNYTPGRLYEKL